MGEGRTFFPTQITSSEPAPMEQRNEHGQPAQSSTWNQPEIQWWSSCNGLGASVLGNSKRRSWGGLREENQVARKKERFADEIGVVLEREGSGFWDASGSKVNSLSLEVLRVQWLGADTDQPGTSYQHPSLGRGTHRGGVINSTFRTKRQLACTGDRHASNHTIISIQQPCPRVSQMSTQRYICL